MPVVREQSMLKPAMVTFDDLSERVDDYIQRTGESRPGRVERWSFATVFFSAGLGILFGQLVVDVTGLVVACGALVIECVAVVTYLVLMIRRQWKGFRHAHRSFAKGLDHDYVIFHECVSWLSQFPDAEIGRKLRYVRDRRQMMSHRLGLFTGGLERLGILPLIVVLYLQFKDWTFGDWGALSHVNLLGGLLLWALLLAYGVAWFLVRLRTRLDAYEALLAERMQLAE